LLHAQVSVLLLAAARGFPIRKNRPCAIDSRPRHDRR
jgi:hypothetical protein